MLPQKYDVYVNAADKAVSLVIMGMLKIPEGWTHEDYWKFFL